MSRYRLARALMEGRGEGYREGPDRGHDVDGIGWLSIGAQSWL
jgi:hypothetical protein